jgi:class 3 adenylate cyclase/tetratricopeptide (TPR) repeat protein
MSVSTQESANPPVLAPEVTGERRHLTILFCDLVGSVTLAAQLDPEEWRATVAGYQRVASEAITGFGGEVVRYVGDGIMAFFGYPVAHDNDAERAARAALAILEKIAKLNDHQSGRPKLSVRIGIDSGPVVVGTGTGNAVDAFGDAANIAARVQAAAEPGTVMISDATQRLVVGLFVVEDRAAQALKGIPQPLRLYRVVRPSGMRGRFEAMTSAGGLTRFVGREDELRSLQSRWQRVLDGEGQVALIIGEAGIGKSRLVQRFHEQIVGTPHTWIEAGAGAFFQNTPFYPISEMLRQFVDEAPASDQIAALAPRLAAVGLQPAEAIPLIGPLLNLPLPLEYPPLALSSDLQRRRLLATLVEWVLGSARAQPLVIATEDLHWVDPSTLELIQLMVEQGATARLLLLYTARPEFHPPWTMRAHHMQITLNRLSAPDVRTIVGEVAAQKALSDETIATVVERTGGVPLFVEELTRAVLESGDAKLLGREIPATLHDSLMARLDRLGSAKEVIQVGAVIGSDFSYELLHAVHPIAETDLQRALRSLTDAELLYVRGIAPEATYQFKHALIRDAAYEALLKSRRKELHLSVARTIDEKFPGIKETHAEVLARHWTEAREIELAIAAWQKASATAQGRSAFQEALENYQQALGLLVGLPESPERDSREVTFRICILQMLQITKGWSSHEAADAAKQVSALAERSGDLEPLAESLARQAFAAWIASDLSAALDLADRAHQLRVRLRNAHGLARSHMMEVMVRYWLGDFVAADQYFEGGVPFFDEPGFLANPIGTAVAAFGYGSYVAWSIGRPDVARQRLDKMRAVTDRNNPHIVTFAGYHEAWIWDFLRDYRRSEAAASRALDLSEKHHFLDSAARARCLLGHARVELGRSVEGIALLGRGLSEWAGITSPLALSYYMATAAAAQGLQGNISDALVTVEQALRTNPEQRAIRPKMYRIRGDLYLQVARLELAEADFREAIALAQSMRAKAWELRATTSLARLLRDSGRREEARTMLAATYNWFTEGFDTADLRDAKALLDELGG